MKAKKATAALMLAVAMAMSGYALAEEHAEAPAAADAAGEAKVEADNTPHPQLSGDAHWAAYVAELIGVMFVSAALVGPLVRKEAPKEVPPAHSHDEPPGSSGHHGAGGTHELNPPEGHHHPHHH